MNKEIQKKYFCEFYKKLNNDYYDYVFKATESNSDFQTRTEYGIMILSKYINAYRRSLISKSDYNNYRNAIENFIFNK